MKSNTLGQMKLFFCKSWKSWGSAVLPRTPFFWVLGLLTAVGRTKPRFRLVGENGLGSRLIVMGLHSLLQMALLNQSLFVTVHVLAFQVKAS